MLFLQSLEILTSTFSHPLVSLQTKPLTKMFTRIASALVLVSVAMAIPQYVPGPVDSCNVGDLQCCDQVQTVR